ncbi:MAG: ribonuclease P protein subunit [Promethearchaeota archaeon]|jgi:RNase P/RNase MRP subunit p29
MIDPKFLIYHDLIGIQVYSKLKSKNFSKKFLDIGFVVDETRNLLITEQNGTIKKYIKKDYIFRFRLHPSKEEEEHFLEVQGNKIVGLPVNRLRSLKKKRWFKI